MPSRRLPAHVYWRRRIVALGILGVLIYLPVSLLAPLRAADADPVDRTPPATAPAELQWPRYGAGAIGAIGYPGVLAERGTTDPLPMASITKVVTALVVLDRMPLEPGEQGPVYRTTEADVAMTLDMRRQNIRTGAIRAGLELTERQLLELVLIDSASNYARALTAWVFGSEAAYADAATAWLEREGLAGITVVEPTGVDPRNAATAPALVELGKRALDHPVVAEIVATARAVIPGVGEIESTNELLGTLGVDGIKTGTLLPSTANLLFSADLPVGNHTVSVVGVVLGGPNHDLLARDVSALLRAVEAGFADVQVAQAGEEFATFETAWGQRASAVAAAPASLLVWGDTPVEAEVDLAEVRSGRAGDRVGEAVFRSGPASVAVELVLSGDVTDPGPLWRFFNPLLLF